MRSDIARSHGMDYWGSKILSLLQYVQMDSETQWAF
jgi:hypothetical protein